jgi:hypothetical protein
MSTFITDENPEMLAMSTVSEVVGEKFVGTTGPSRDEDFDAVLAATVLEKGYDDFFAETSRAFDLATPSELSRVAMDILSKTDGLNFDESVKMGATDKSAPSINLDKPTELDINNR